MATAKTSRIKYGSPGKSVFFDATAMTDSSVSYAQGDLLVVKNGLIQLPSSEGENSAFVGISDNVVVSGQLQSPYQGLATTANAGPQMIPPPRASVVAELILKSGDGFAPGGLVYGAPATGPQVVSSAGTKAIGVFQGAAITGDGAVRGLVMLGHRFPGDTLVINF